MFPGQRLGSSERFRGRPERSGNVARAHFSMSRRRQTGPLASRSSGRGNSGRATYFCAVRFETARSRWISARPAKSFGAIVPMIKDRPACFTSFFRYGILTGYSYPREGGNMAEKRVDIGALAAAIAAGVLRRAAEVVVITANRLEESSRELNEIQKTALAHTTLQCFDGIEIEIAAELKGELEREGVATWGLSDHLARLLEREPQEAR